MIINKSKMNRTAIFFFFDVDGIVDKYVTYFLEHLMPSIDRLIVIANGKLTPEGRQSLLKITDEVIVRDNEGYDVWAYKAGIDYIGWEGMENVSELLLINSTMFGPLYDFKEMFDEMDNRDVDFWGITKHHQVPFDCWQTCKYNYIPEHIQSSFIAIRQPLLSSYDYKTLWDTMPMINSYAESVGKYEAIFTIDFENKGYTSDVYVNTEDLREHTKYPLMMMAEELVKNRKCPVVKRKNFSQNYYDFLEETMGQQTYEVFEYIKNNLNYDTDMILENIIRSYNMADIKKMLHLNYILPYKYKIENNYERNKIALVIHIYFDDLIDYCFEYSNNMVDYADVFVTTKSVEMKEKIEKKFFELKCNKLTVEVIENRGRDVSALLVPFKDVLLDYDYICFAHDKKTTQLKPLSVGESFSYKCFENILGSKEFVENIITTFDNNERLGMLSPPPPNHGSFYQTLAGEWASNFSNTCSIAYRLGIKVPVHAAKEPIAPLGTMFWFRAKALKALIEHDWEYSDFPEEPNHTDGTLLHAIERVYGLVCQAEGYLSGWIMSDKCTSMEVTNLNFMLRELNKLLYPKFGLSRFFVLTENIKWADFSGKGVPFHLKARRRAKKILPRPLFILSIKMKRFLVGPKGMKGNFD